MSPRTSNVSADATCGKWDNAAEAHHVIRGQGLDGDTTGRNQQQHAVSQPSSFERNTGHQQDLWMQIGVPGGGPQGLDMSKLSLSDTNFSSGTTLTSLMAPDTTGPSSWAQDGGVDSDPQSENNARHLNSWPLAPPPPPPPQQQQQQQQQPVAPPQNAHLERLAAQHHLGLQSTRSLPSGASASGSGDFSYALRDHFAMSSGADHAYPRQQQHHHQQQHQQVQQRSLQHQPHHHHHHLQLQQADVHTHLHHPGMTPRHASIDSFSGRSDGPGTSLLRQGSWDLYQQQAGINGGGAVRVSELPGTSLLRHNSIDNYPGKMDHQLLLAQGGGPPPLPSGLSRHNSIDFHGGSSATGLSRHNSIDFYGGSNAGGGDVHSPSGLSRQSSVDVFAGRSSGDLNGGPTGLMRQASMDASRPQTGGNGGGSSWHSFVKKKEMKYLLREINLLPNKESILMFVNEFLHKLDLINQVTCLYRLAKMYNGIESVSKKQQWQIELFSHPYFNLLIERIKLSLSAAKSSAVARQASCMWPEEFDMRCVSNLLWALLRLELGATACAHTVTILQDLMQLVEHFAPRCDILQGLASLLWGFAKLPLPPLRTVMVLIRRITELLLDGGGMAVVDAQAISNSVWSLAHVSLVLGSKGPDVLLHAAAEAGADIKIFLMLIADSTISMLKSLHMGMGPEEIAAKYSGCSARALLKDSDHKFSNQSLVNIAWSFMTLLGSTALQYESVNMALKYIRLIIVCRLHASSVAVQDQHLKERMPNNASFDELYMLLSELVCAFDGTLGLDQELMCLVFSAAAHGIKVDQGNQRSLKFKKFVALISVANRMPEAEPWEFLSSLTQAMGSAPAGALANLQPCEHEAYNNAVSSLRRHSKRWNGAPSGGGGGGPAAAGGGGVAGFGNRHSPTHGGKGGGGRSGGRGGNAAAAAALQLQQQLQASDGGGGAASCYLPQQRTHSGSAMQHLSGVMDQHQLRTNSGSALQHLSEHQQRHMSAGEVLDRGAGGDGGGDAQQSWLKSMSFMDAAALLPQLRGRMQCPST